MLMNIFVEPTFWASLVNGIVTVTALGLSLKHARTLQSKQLEHDTKERMTERQMSWRREVYLSAAESIARLNGLVGQLADLTFPDSEISKSYQEDMAKVNKVQIIASDKTVSTVNAFLTDYVSAYAAIFVERAKVKARKNEIDLLEAKLGSLARDLEHWLGLVKEISQVANEAQQKQLAMQLELGRRQAEYFRERRESLAAGLPQAQLALYESTVDAAFRLSSTLLAAFVSVREELGLGTDIERYAREGEVMREKLMETTRAVAAAAKAAMEDSAADEPKTEAAGV